MKRLWKWILTAFLLCAVPAGAQTIDHTSLPQFEQLTAGEIAGAASLRMAFIGRSVGWNISNGLTCMEYFPMNTVPSACKRDQLETWTQSYPRGNWVYFGWPGLGLFNPVTCTGFNGLWTGYQPCFFTGLTPQAWDVVSFQFDYTVGSWSDSVANYFTVRAGDHDVFDFTQWAAGVAPVRAILWSTSLARVDPVGMPRLAEFNTQARLWAAAHPDVLFIDLADIESHTPDGTQCTDAQGFPNLCDEYTNEVSGGHLNATGQVRVAKAVWLAMASMGTYVPPPPPPPPCPYVCTP